MKRRSYKFYIRKAHRYLGVLIGIQFILWTLGGLYFSWTNIEEIRGEHLRTGKHGLEHTAELLSPAAGIEEIRRTPEVSTINAVRLIEVLGSPSYVFDVALENGDARQISMDAVSGKIRSLILEDEAKTIAANSLVKPLKITNAVLLNEDSVGAHHEYREKPLPAWAVTFETGMTVYVSAGSGEIGAFRTNEWRLYDLLWMLHTMGYAARDNFNNYLLRAFSLFGIITVLSGFSLFLASSRFFRTKIFGERRNLRENGSSH